MPVKSTERKATSKVATKAAEIDKKIAENRSHIEKKFNHNDTCDSQCGCKSVCCYTKLAIFVLIIVNLILTICLFVKANKPDAWDIETMKVGGKENMEKAVKFYKSQYYIDYQKESVEAYLGQINAQ